MENATIIAADAINTTYHISTGYRGDNNRVAAQLRAKGFHAFTECPADARGYIAGETTARVLVKLPTIK